MNRLLVVILLCCGINLTVIGQGPDAIFSTFQKSNFAGLSNYLAKEVDVCLINEQNFYSKAKTVEKLTSFFNSQLILSIEPMHDGASKKKSSSYSVGKVTTKNGKKYKLFIYQEVIGVKNQIAEIRIENFND